MNRKSRLMRFDRSHRYMYTVKRYKRISQRYHDAPLIENRSRAWPMLHIQNIQKSSALCIGPYLLKALYVSPHVLRTYLPALYTCTNYRVGLFM